MSASFLQEASVGLCVAIAACYLALQGLRWLRGSATNSSCHGCRLPASRCCQVKPLVSIETRVVRAPAPPLSANCQHDR